MAQSRPGPSGQSTIFMQVHPYQGGDLILASPSIDADGWLSAVHSQAEDAASPPLSWSGPLGAASYALVVEDPDAPREQPALHWMLWNIPGSTTALPGDIGPGFHPAAVPGMIQGRNSRGEHAWLGMAPPPGETHRYHFQLFGLDRRLHLPVDTPLVEVLHVLKAATLFKGELIGRFQGPVDVGDAASPARTGSYGVDPAVDHVTRAEEAAGRGPLDSGDIDRHAPHDPDGVVRPRGGEPPDPKRPFRL